VTEFCSVALTVDKLTGAGNEVRMLREQLSSRDAALTLARSELDSVRCQIEQLNQNYQTALNKYDRQQQLDTILDLFFFLSVLLI